MAVQWLGICLSVQETPIQPLVWEDSTHWGTTMPSSCIELRSTCLEPTTHKKNHRPEKPAHHTVTATGERSQEQLDQRG